jgi:hypothetical protein
MTEVATTVGRRPRAPSGSGAAPPLAFGTPHAGPPAPKPRAAVATAALRTVLATLSPPRSVAAEDPGGPCVAHAVLLVLEYNT